MPRKHTSILTQLRTEHVPLQKFLYRINKAESPLCPNCLCEQEMVIHYLLRCSAFQVQRGALQIALGHNARSIPYLLSQEKALKHIFKFIAATGRFTSTFGKIPDLKRDHRKRR